MSKNEARVQVDIGVQVNPQEEPQNGNTVHWCYALVGLLCLETLALLYLLGF